MVLLILMIIARMPPMLSKQTATTTHFIVDSELTLKSGDEVLLHRTWHHEIPR